MEKKRFLSGIVFPNNRNIISQRTRIMGSRFGETLVNVLHVINSSKLRVITNIILHI